MARRRAERDRILDILEEEEQIEQEKEEAEERERFQTELEKRKAAAKAEMDALKTAREMHKKMGKALLQNLAVARERDEQEKQALAQADRQAREERTRLKPKKSVTFADLPPDHENQPANSVPLDWGDVAPVKLKAGKSTVITRGEMNKLPMKMNVVERVPGLGRGPKSPPPQSSAPADSDDESDPGSPVPVDSDDGGIIHSDLSDSEDGPAPDHDESEGSGSEQAGDDEPAEWDIEGYDFAQHQREIALAYYEKRATLGAEALAAMRNHEHGEEENEWDQPVSGSGEFEQGDLADTRMQGRTARRNPVFRSSQAATISFQDVLSVQFFATFAFARRIHPALIPVFDAKIGRAARETQKREVDGR